MAEEQTATKAAPSRRYYIVSDKSGDAACLVGANAPSQALYRAAAQYCDVRVAKVHEVVKLMQAGADVIDPVDEPELPLEKPAPPGTTQFAGDHSTGVFTDPTTGTTHVTDGVKVKPPLADGPLIGDAADHSPPPEGEIL